jgi:hypothetical protein
MPQHHVAAALGAELFEWNVGHALALVQAARSAAIRISRAGHELAEAPALEHHHAPAVLAVLVLAGLRHLRRIQLRQVDGIFLGEGAALRIVFFI